MTRYLLAGAATVALLGFGYGYIQHQKVEGLEASLAAERAKVRALTVQRDLARAAAELEANRAAKARQRAEDTQAAIEALLTGDITNADTPVDPRLADYLDCLRRAGTGRAACSRHLAGDEDPVPDQ